MDKTKQLSCPLCKSSEFSPHFKNKQRKFFCCVVCNLVFVPANQHLSKKEEKTIYDLHQNDPFDEDYRYFLSRLTIPMIRRLNPGDWGLDFGCGPGPALAEMMKENGFKVDLYDPIYHNNTQALNKSYDFVCCTEVVEHFRTPAQDISLLFSMLKPGGWLGIMTKLTRDREAFKNWHYKNDLTHVCFYSRTTFNWLAKKFKSSVEYHGSDVIIFKTNEQDLHKSLSS